MRRRRRLFCANPFRWLEVTGPPGPKGTAYLCCPSWLPRPVGNVLQQRAEDVWNGPEAQAMRASILDGSFRHCRADRCPHLQAIDGPVQSLDDVQDPELRDIITHRRRTLPTGPRQIKCSYDKSCNLACPTCRHHAIIETDASKAIDAIHHTLQEHYLEDAHELHITGSGDAFGSPHFNRWLRTMDVGQMPQLRTLHLHTNGQLWTPSMWARLPPPVRDLVTSAEISIDAARAATYAVNRPPGNFDRLLDNLAFIQTLRQHGPLRHLKFSMVVQANNVHEMADFVALGKRFSADDVYFSQLVNWGTFNPAQFAARAVHLPHHPQHRALRRMLRDPALQDPVVSLGNLLV